MARFCSRRSGATRTFTNFHLFICPDSSPDVLGLTPSSLIPPLAMTLYASTQRGGFGKHVAKGNGVGRISTGMRAHHLYRFMSAQWKWDRNPMQSPCLCLKHLDGRSGTKDPLCREHHLREVAWISSFNQVIALQCVSS